MAAATAPASAMSLLLLLLLLPLLLLMLLLLLLLLLPPLLLLHLLLLLPRLIQLPIYISNGSSLIESGLSVNCLSLIIIRFFLFFFNTIFVSSHMYPENPEGTQVIIGSMNMGYIYPTLPGIELITCSVPSGSRSH